MKKLWEILGVRRQGHFLLLLMLMLLSSIFEIVSIGAILPFLGVLTAPDQVFEHALMQPLIHFLGLNNSNELALPLTVLFSSVAIMAGTIRLMLLYVINKLAFATGSDISVEIYRRTLYQPYSTHISRNSSEIINAIINKTHIIITDVILPILTIINSTLLVVGIMTVLVFIDAEIALYVFSFFGFFYWIVAFYTKNNLKNNSYEISQNSTLMIKALQEGLGGIRDILLNGNQRFYCQLFRKSDILFRHASASNKFISGSPRFILETFGMVLIAILAYFMTTNEESSVSVVPILGALALGAQRLLPALQQSYNAYSGIKGSSASLKDVVSLLSQPLPCGKNYGKDNVVSFDTSIQLKNLSFGYSDDLPLIFKDINLVIKKGSKVGFIGETGCGKSTIVDVIMGLLSPKNGELVVDGIPIGPYNLNSCQAHIAHVPQNIYLSDGTIEENIAFGFPKKNIDRKMVKKFAKKSKISDFIEKMEGGYRASVGEQGIRLSGGQRQRIGIARALYKQADVIIFDEATSALDVQTEEKIMEEINELEGSITVLIIAHRLETLKKCDQIIELKKGKLIVHCGTIEVQRITG